MMTMGAMPVEASHFDVEYLSSQDCHPREGWGIGISNWIAGFSDRPMDFPAVALAGPWDIVSMQPPRPNAGYIDVQPGWNTYNRTFTFPLFPGGKPNTCNVTVQIYGLTQADKIVLLGPCVTQTGKTQLFDVAGFNSNKMNAPERGDFRGTAFFEEWSEIQVRRYDGNQFDHRGHRGHRGVSIGRSWIVGSDRGSWRIVGSFFYIATSS